MAKDLKISVLLDFYGNMLTDKQKNVLELYYNEDLSLAEIGAFTDITRQGVRDSIKRGEAILLELEDKLGLYEKYKKQSGNLKEVNLLTQKIASYNDKFFYSADISALCEKVIKLTEESLKED